MLRASDAYEEFNLVMILVSCLNSKYLDVPFSENEDSSRQAKTKRQRRRNQMRRLRLCPLLELKVSALGTRARVGTYINNEWERQQKSGSIQIYATKIRQNDDNCCAHRTRLFCPSVRLSDRPPASPRSRTQTGSMCWHLRPPELNFLCPSINVR